MEGQEEKRCVVYLYRTISVYGAAQRTQGRAGPCTGVLTVGHLTKGNNIHWMCIGELARKKGETGNSAEQFYWVKCGVSKQFLGH